jgi:hypothetical protein
MTNTTPRHTHHLALTEPTDMHDMVVVHRVFRRELTVLPALLRDTPAGDLARAAEVGGHARLILSGLHLHHTSEDDLLWPLLLERSAPSGEVVARMQSQHAAVDELTDRLGTVLDRWEAEARPAVATEAAGLQALQIGASRRYDGPMGKSDRAAAVGLVCFLLAVGVPGGAWLTWAFAALAALAILTVLNRSRTALAEGSRT